MGGLVARRAAERLGPRLRGLILIDPTPETSSICDNWDQRLPKYAEGLPDGRFKSVDSAHLMQAEQPQLIATEILQLLHIAATNKYAASPTRGGRYGSGPVRPSVANDYFRRANCRSM
jgi:hypothetical protein